MWLTERRFRSEGKMRSAQALLLVLGLYCLLELLLRSGEVQKVPEIRYHEQHLYRYNEDKYGGLLLLEKGSNADETSPTDQSGNATDLYTSTI